MRHEKWAGGLGLVCALATTREVAAESVARGALSLDGAVMVSENITATPSDSSSSVDQSVDVSSTAWGLLSGGFGLGAAYGVSNNVVIAGQIMVTSSSFERKQNATGDTTPSTDSSSVSIYPRVEYVFGGYGSFRPYVAGIFGLSSRSSSSGESEVTSSRQSFGAGIGAHGFVASQFSIDPLFSVHRLGGSDEFTSGSLSSSSDVTGTMIALTVSLTGWFGGSASPAPSEPIASPAAEVRRAPAAPSAPTDDADLGDTVESAPLKTTQVVPGDHAIMLKARPEALPKSVMIRLAESTSSDKLRDCSEVRLVVGDRSYRIEHLAFRGRRQVGNQQRVVSDGLLPAQAIYGALDVEGAHLDVCGNSWLLTAPVRDAFRTFLSEFARRRGTPFEAPQQAPGPDQAPAPEGGEPTPPASTTPAPATTAPTGTSPATPTQAAPSAAPPPAKPPAKPAPRAP